MIEFGVKCTIDCPTTYWAECDDQKIEFTVLELDNPTLMELHGEKFKPLFDYIQGLFIHRDMELTEEQLAAGRARLKQRRPECY